MPITPPPPVVTTQNVIADPSPLTVLAVETLPHPPSLWLNKSFLLSIYDLENMGEFNLIFLKGKPTNVSQMPQEQVKANDHLSDRPSTFSLQKEALNFRTG